MRRDRNSITGRTALTSEGSLDELGEVGRYGQLEGRLMPAFGHFGPGALQDAKQFLFVVLGGEVGQIEFQKNKTGDIFYRLALGVGLEVLFLEQGRNVRNRLVVVAAVG
jgi:hypothetical protein